VVIHQQPVAKGVLFLKNALSVYYLSSLYFVILFGFFIERTSIARV